jgi:hypothetical protein
MIPVDQILPGRGLRHWINDMLAGDGLGRVDYSPIDAIIHAHDIR